MSSVVADLEISQPASEMRGANYGVIAIVVLALASAAVAIAYPSTADGPEQSPYVATLAVR